MISEIWKDIQGYEGAYQISNHGNVKSFKKYKEGKYLKFRINNNGYKYVSLYDFYKCPKIYFIARLVALYFLENPNNNPQVNHINGNKEDNCVENLEWCTVSQNHKHAYRLGLKKPRGNKGENNPKAKLTQNDVTNIRLLLQKKY